MSYKNRFILALTLLLCAGLGYTQTQNAPPAEVAGIPVNYDEAKIAAYTLPDPLMLSNGKPVRDAKHGTKNGALKSCRLYEENQFGRSPARPAGMSFDVFDKGTPVSMAKRYANR